MKISRCLPCCVKKPAQVVVPPSKFASVKKAALAFKAFTVAHKKALIGATAIAVAGTAVYAYRETITSMFSSLLGTATAPQKSWLSKFTFGLVQ
ncbi:MAG: hypothetical protein RLZZ453_274 [Chlamydiota bacterium]|jgi:hypothetical protein